MGIFDFLFTMKGPEFLALYAGWLVFTRLGVTILRRQGYDYPMVTLGGLALYEGLGALRMWIGSAHGLHRWDILIVMMIGGAFVFLVRAKDFGNRSSGGSCSGAVGSSGGGCGSGGGGGCGGGGCGGCGGS